MKKNKVFVGVNNIAGMASSTANALKKVGISAQSFSFKKHPFGYACDNEDILYIPRINRNFIAKIFINKYTIPFFRRIQYFNLLAKSIFQFDTFIFISTDTIFLNQADLPILKFFNKKVSFMFVGCPERNPFDIYNSQNGSPCSICKDTSLKEYLKCDNPEKKSKRIKNVEKYADVIFSQRDTLGFLTDLDKIKHTYILSENEGDFNEEKFNRKKIKISHFPSHKQIKGTKYVDKAIKNLSDLNIEYFSRKVSNDEVKRELKDTSILIDQFNHGHGLLSVEAMSFGCVVICRTAEWFRNDYPGLPIISCKPEELTSVLKKLIKDREKMKKIAKNGLKYYKKFHSMEAGGLYYKKTLRLE